MLVSAHIYKSGSSELEFICGAFPDFTMATNVATADLPCATSCPLKDSVAYERIILDLEDRLDMKKEVEDAMDVLDYVMCRVPDK